MSQGAQKRPPLSPREVWISDGRQVLHFRPTLWERWSQRLEITSAELMRDLPVPLLKKRLELSQEKASGLWNEKRAHAVVGRARCNGSLRRLQWSDVLRDRCLAQPLLPAPLSRVLPRM